MEFEKLLLELNKRLREIESIDVSIIKRSNLAINYCKKVLAELNQIISSSLSLPEEKEIYFFKNIKSIPLSQLIFYTEVGMLEISIPKLGIDNQRKHIEKNIKRINRFFSVHKDFVQYVEQQKTCFDSIYYTRKNTNLFSDFSTNHYFRIPEFSTSHDIKLAKVIGLGKFLKYLDERLESLLTDNYPAIKKEYSSKLKWTSSKVALIELIYALQSSGAINGGAVDLKELASLLENVFNVNLGDYYRTYLEIKMRKYGQTKFIDSLKDSLEKRILESDK